LTVTATAQTSVQYRWSASTDNVGVAGYRVRRNATVVASTSSTSWLDQGLSAGTSYTYSVVAFDAAGNESAPSSGVTLTLGGGKPR